MCIFCFSVYFFSIFFRVLTNLHLVEGLCVAGNCTIEDDCDLNN